jgi:hypothetical protein
LFYHGLWTLCELFTQIDFHTEDMHTIQSLASPKLKSLALRVMENLPIQSHDSI